MLCRKEKKKKFPIGNFCTKNWLGKLFSMVNNLLNEIIILKLTSFSSSITTLVSSKFTTFFPYLLKKKMIQMSNVVFQSGPFKEFRSNSFYFLSLSIFWRCGHFDILLVDQKCVAVAVKSKQTSAYLLCKLRALLKCQWCVMQGCPNRCLYTCACECVTLLSSCHCQHVSEQYKSFIFHINISPAKFSWKKSQIVHKIERKSIV